MKRLHCFIFLITVISFDLFGSHTYEQKSVRIYIHRVRICASADPLPDTDAYPWTQADKACTPRQSTLVPLSEQDILASLENLQEAFAPAQICFDQGPWMKLDYFCPTMCDLGGDLYSNLLQLVENNGQTHSDGIDIYFLPTGFGGQEGLAPVEFGKSVVITGEAANGTGSKALVHEMGHALGLLHTHVGSGLDPYEPPGACSELPAGSNCRTCGDLICDTSADPGLSANTVVQVNGIWTYTGDPAYSPDIHNIMSYAPLDSREHFSLGQMHRMHELLESSISHVLVPGVSCFASPCFEMGSGFVWDLDEPPAEFDGLDLTSITGNNDFDMSEVQHHGRIVGETAIIAGGQCILDERQIFRFESGTEVRLTPGFEVKSGTGFYAVVKSLDCNNLRVKRPTSTPFLSAKLPKLTISPNPFLDQTHIRWEMVEKGQVDLKIFDAFGHLIAHPYDGQTVSTGKYSWIWRPARNSPGLYLVVIQSKQGRSIKKILLKK